MTSLVSVTNEALQRIGTQTTITSMSENSNEAIQSNLVIESLRDRLLRMAPWDCATAMANLTYITSTPGTAGNPVPGSSAWAPGLPPPPWAYEYQYPVDCLRALWVVSQFVPGFTGAIPITTALTGGLPLFGGGPPVRFKIGIDEFFTVTAATVAAGGTGYAVGDIITLDTTPAGDTPIGAPAQLVVATVALGVILTVTVVNQILGETAPLGGSYFTRPTNPVAQSETTGSGSGATFNLTLYQVNSVVTKLNQRVILTNQPSAILSYIRQVTDANVMDTLFIDAWVSVLASRLAFQLSGDKALANMLIGLANNSIVEARKADANEGLTINNVTPDWIRVRGIVSAGPPFSPGVAFEWGPLWTTF